VFYSSKLRLKARAVDVTASEQTNHRRGSPKFAEFRLVCLFTHTHARTPVNICQFLGENKMSARFGNSCLRCCSQGAAVPPSLEPKGVPTQRKNVDLFEDLIYMC